MTSPTKRDVERRLDDLEGDDGSGDIEEASIAILLSSMNTDEYDPMDGEPGLVRCFGKLYQIPDLPLGDHGEGDDEQ